MSPGMRPDSAALSAFILYTSVCVCLVCIMIYCEENTHDVPSPAPASAATDPARRVCVCVCVRAIIFIDIFPTWKKNFVFFILLRAGLYYCYYCTMRWWWWWRFPPAHPLPGFSFPFFSVYCRLLLLLLSRRFLLLIKWLSGFHFSFLGPFTTHKIPALLRRLTLIFACGPPPPPPPTRVIFIKRQQLSLSFDSHLYLFIWIAALARVCVILTHLVRRWGITTWKRVQECRPPHSGLHRLSLVFFLSSFDWTRCWRIHQPNTIVLILSLVLFCIRWKRFTWHSSKCF